MKRAIMVACLVWTTMLFGACADDPDAPALPDPGAEATGGGKLAEQAGGFYGSCPDVWLSYRLGQYGDWVIFEANCYNNAGQKVYAGQIHLDWVVTNNQGRLQWNSNGYGGFQNSCWGCGLYHWNYGLGGTTYQKWGCSNNDWPMAETCSFDCTCADSNGGQHGAEDSRNHVNLNTCIANYDGHLAYVC